MEAEMMRLTPLLFGGGMLFAVPALAADHPPQLDVQSSCNAVASRGMNGRTKEACMDEENSAQSTLRDKWAQFSPSQRSRCSGLVQTGGPPSYVELLTCMQMAQDAKSLPQDKTDGPNR